MNCCSKKIKNKKQCLREDKKVFNLPRRFSQKQCLSQPIKGTLRRGLNVDEDKKLLDEFKNSYKDISENVMITDLVRNDLSIDALKSTVRVKELSKIYTFEKVHQMISTITSKVDAKCCFTELLKSTFPMGSMTGAPKLKSMELIKPNGDLCIKWIIENRRKSCSS